MAKFVPKVFPDILQRMINRVVARTALSDLTDTSVFKTILAAVAREVDDAYYQINNKLDVFSIDRASGDDLDRRAEDYNPVAISRRQAVAATGPLVFSRNTVNPGPDITIPIGTEVEVPGESEPIVAATTAVGTILTGATTTGSISAVINEAGDRGNVASGQLTKFRGKPSGVDTVTNPTPFVGGLDRELDDSFRERLRQHILGLAKSTVNALESAAKETVDATTGQGVRFAKAVEDIINLGNVDLFIDDGTGVVETNAAVAGEILTSGPEFPGDVAQGGETILFTDNKPLKDIVTPVLTKNPGAIVLVRDDPGATGYTLNPASGKIVLNTALIAGDDVTIDYTYYTGLIQLVQKVIDGDPLDRPNFPGVRAAGVLVKVVPPTSVNIQLTIDITVLDGFDQTDAADQVRQEVASYINGLGIGNDVILAEVIERGMGVAGMFDMAILSPTANQTLLEDQLPRVNNAATDITIN